MARHELRVKPSMAKDLRGVPKADVRRILARIAALAADPRGPGCEKPAGAGEAPPSASPRGCERIQERVGVAGVASRASVASNAAKAERAKNRRVERMAQ